MFSSIESAKTNKKGSSLHYPHDTMSLIAFRFIFFRTASWRSHTGSV